MKSRKATEFFLAKRDAEKGMPIADACEKHGITTKTYYKLRKKLGEKTPQIKLTLSVSEELQQLRQENSRLLRLVASLTEKLLKT